VEVLKHLALTRGEKLRFLREGWREVELRFLRKGWREVAILARGRSCDSCARGGEKLRF
jgi:hypothetical protein